MVLTISERLNNGAKNMRTLQSLMLVLSITLCAGSAFAQTKPVSNNWGLGFMLGWPSGITLKNYVTDRSAWDFGVGVGPGVRLHVDYLGTLVQFANTADFYLGVGGVLVIGNGWCGRTYDPGHACSNDDTVYGGLRVPIGLDIRPADGPISLGVEVAPGLWFGQDVLATLLDAYFFLRVLF
jgi:hypothetical protein